MDYSTYARDGVRVLAERYQLQVKERETPAAFGRSYGGADAYGANVAGALVPLGGAMMKWAEYLKKRQDEWDAATVANAQNEYMKRMNEWMNDPKTGQKANRPLGAARGMADDTYQYGNALKDQISGQLENDAQRAAFGKIADKAMLPFWKNASEYEAKQVKQYQDQAYQGAMDQSADMVMRSPTDPYALETAREQRHNAIRSQMYGAAPEAVDQAIQESDSELDQKRYEAQAQSDPVGAMHGIEGDNALSPEAKAKLREQVGPVAEMHERQAAVDEMVQQYPHGQEEAGLEHIKKHYEGEKGEAIASAYQQRMKELGVEAIEEKRAQQAQQGQNYAEIEKKWGGGQRPSQGQLDAWSQDGTISEDQHGQLSRRLETELNVAQSREEALKELEKSPGWGELTPVQQEERVMRRMGVTKETRESALTHVKEGILEGRVSQDDVHKVYSYGWITKNERDSLLAMSETMANMTQGNKGFLADQKKAMKADLGKIKVHAKKNKGVMQDVANAKFMEIVGGLDPTSPTYRQDVMAARRAAVVAGVEASNNKLERSGFWPWSAPENTKFGDAVAEALGGIDQDAERVRSWEPEFQQDDITLPPNPYLQGQGRGESLVKEPGMDHEMKPWFQGNYEQEPQPGRPDQDGEMKPWFQGNDGLVPEQQEDWAYRPRTDSDRKNEIRDAMRENPNMSEDEMAQRFGGSDIDQAIARGFYREIQKENEADAAGNPSPEQGAGSPSRPAGDSPLKEGAGVPSPEQGAGPKEGANKESQEPRDIFRKKMKEMPDWSEDDMVRWWSSDPDKQAEARRLYREVEEEMHKNGVRQHMEHYPYKSEDEVANWWSSDPDKQAEARRHYREIKQEQEQTPVRQRQPEQPAPGPEQEPGPVQEGWPAPKPVRQRQAAPRAAQQQQPAQPAPKPAQGGWPAPKPVRQKQAAPEQRPATGGVNEALNAHANANLGRGYSWGRWDCSALVRHAWGQMAQQINKAAGREVFNKAARRAVSGASADIIQRVSKGTGWELTNPSVSNLRPGMIIGLNKNPNRAGGNGYKGIDHVGFVVERNGKLMVYEANSKQGTVLTDAAAYLARYREQGVPSYVVDPTRLAQGSPSPAQGQKAKPVRQNPSPPGPYPDGHRLSPTHTGTGKGRGGVAAQQGGGNFDAAMAVVYRNEGGEVNDPHDRGGHTNMGVTKATLNNAYKRGIVGHSNPSRLTKAEASKIYHEMFWKPSKAGEMPDPVATVYFDMYVHHGASGGPKLLQRALRGLGHNVKIDGAVGPQTLAAVKAQASTPQGARALANMLCDVRQTRFEEIVAGNSTQRKFLRGWTNRNNRMRKIANGA